MHSGTTITNIIRAAALLAFVVAAVIALLDQHGPVSGYAVAAGAVGAGLALLAHTLASRQDREQLKAHIASAPREAYYRGYGDCASDANEAFSGSVQLH